MALTISSIDKYSRVCLNVWAFPNNRAAVPCSHVQLAGVRLLFACGSRVVFRLSGTSSAGATIRMYLESYTEPSGDLAKSVADALGELVEVALQLAKIEQFTGRKEPTVIT